MSGSVRWLHAGYKPLLGRHPGAGFAGLVLYVISISCRSEWRFPCRWWFGRVTDLSFLLDRVSLRGSGYPGVHSIEQAGLRFRSPAAAP